MCSILFQSINQETSFIEEKNPSDTDALGVSALALCVFFDTFTHICLSASLVLMLQGLKRCCIQCLHTYMHMHT